MQFRKARRSSARMRLALCGPSGSGKTYSSLLIAQGLGGSIALVDTERGSGELYSDLCEYDVLQLTPPFTPGRYVAAIEAAEQAGYDVLVIDSLSHAWSGTGGVLDMQDRAARSLRNSFAAWREVTPEHNRLVEAMLRCDMHLIVTMRTKTAYEVQQDGKKTKVVKVGLAPLQRDGLEYEFTTVLDLAVDGHMASSSKDRTGLFDGRFFVPDAGTGQELRQWLQSAPNTTGCAGEAGDCESLDGTNEGRLEQAFATLGYPGLWEAYREYVLVRYATDALEELDDQAVAEQLRLIGQCRDLPVKRSEFEDLLREREAA